jgi:hypothetical protein
MQPRPDRYRGYRGTGTKFALLIAIGRSQREMRCELGGPDNYRDHGLRDLY